MRQMAVVYNTAAWTQDIVPEFRFTDLEESFYLHLQKAVCVFSKSTDKEVTTAICTSYATWKDISDGKIRGEQAMMKGLYRVRGRFETMLEMDQYFGLKGGLRQNRSPFPGFFQHKSFG